LNFLKLLSFFFSKNDHDSTITEVKGGLRLEETRVNEENFSELNAKIPHRKIS